MAKYFTEFWLVTTDGRKLFPARIKNRDNDRLTFRALAKGDNTKASGEEFDDPIEAIRAFLSGRSLRFGAPGEKDNRFDLRGPKTMKVDATSAFRIANPGLKF